MPGPTMLSRLNLQHPAAKRPLVDTFDIDGKPIVFVELANGSRAKLFRSDFDTLMSLGVRPNWFQNDTGNGHSYVRSRVPAIFQWAGHQAMVARLILRPPQRRATVKYLDGDPLNLRRDNLYAVLAGGRGKAREAILPSSARKRKRTS